MDRCIFRFTILTSLLVCSFLNGNQGAPHKLADTVMPESYIPLPYYYSHRAVPFVETGDDEVGFRQRPFLSNLGAAFLNSLVTSPVVNNIVNNAINSTLTTFVPLFINNLVSATLNATNSSNNNNKNNNDTSATSRTDYPFVREHFEPILVPQQQIQFIPYFYYAYHHQYPLVVLEKTHA